MKRKNLFMSAALMCSLFCLAFTFDDSGIYWLWTDTKPVAVILALAAIIFGVFWLKASRDLKAEV